MKAVILAGGEGSRLRPITCTVPKPLVSLCGKPVALYILELLAKHGITEAVFTLGYMADEIENYFDEPRYKGVSLSFVREKEPLGTAGSVRAAAPSGDILVISGDAMCDFDLSSAMEKFASSGADCAIITKKVEDPREYGLVLADEKSCVRSFLEKPSYESCITDLANTGIYMLTESAVRHIPVGEASDFAKDIFPKMLSGGMKILSVEEDGYWCDIGDIDSYLRCQRDMLEGKVNCILDGHRTLDGVLTSSLKDFFGARITPPVYIGRNVSIADGAVVDKGSVLCDNVTVCRGAKIHGSVILSGAYIGERATCNEAVICDGAKLLSGAAAFEGAVVGSNSVLGENSVAESGVKIWTGKNVTGGMCVSCDIKYGHPEKIRIDDEGVCGETNAVITPQTAAVVGASLASISDKICIGYNDTPSGKAIALAVMSGALSAGADILTLKICTQPELDLATLDGNIGAGCFVEGGAVTKIRLFSKGGLPLTREQERKTEAGLLRSEYHRAGFADFGSVSDISGARELYAIKLGAQLDGITVNAEAYSSDKTVRETAERLLPRNRSRDKIVFNISSDGRKLSAYTEETGYVFYEKLLLLGCVEEFRAGRDVILPYSSPVTADILGKKFGSSVSRYYSCSADGRDRDAREKACHCRFPRDAFLLMSMILKSLSARKITLADAIAELPSFTAASRFVPTEKSPVIILRSVCSEQGGLSEGAVRISDDARILIKPVKTGKGVMMFAESFRNETASELCDFYEKMLTQENCGD